MYVSSWSNLIVFHKKYKWVYFTLDTVAQKIIGLAGMFSMLGNEYLYLYNI